MTQQVRPALLPARRVDRRTATWTVLMLALGVTVALPLGQRPGPAPVSREAEREPAVQSLAWLEAEQQQLKQRISALRATIVAAQQRQVRDRAAVDDAQAELKRQQTIAGLTDMAGPGITLLLDDSAATPVSAALANDSIVHDTDVRDVISALWSAGAEAISVNGERLVASSSIVCVGTVIIINDTRLSPPFRVRAIGPATELERVLDTAPHLNALRRRVRDHGLLLKVAAGERIEVPAHRGPLLGMAASGA